MQLTEKQKSIIMSGLMASVSVALTQFSYYFSIGKFDIESIFSSLVVGGAMFFTHLKSEFNLSPKEREVVNMLKGNQQDKKEK